MAGEDMEGMIIGSVFKCISFLELFNPFLDVRSADPQKHMRMNMENTVVYFFDAFLRKITKDITFVARDSSGMQVNQLDCKHSIFVHCLRYQSVFDSFENYLVLTINKCLGNIGLGEMIIGRYSIFYLRTMVESLKKTLQITDFNNVSIPNHISNELLNINSTNLSDPKYYKLRSDLYEIISICFLEEQREDYIENIHTVINRILEMDLNSGDQHVPVLHPEQRDHALPRCHRSHPPHEDRRSLPGVPQDRLPQDSADHQRPRLETHIQRRLRSRFAGVLRAALLHVARKDES